MCVSFVHAEVKGGAVQGLDHLRVEDGKGILGIFLHLNFHISIFT